MIILLYISIFIRLDTGRHNDILSRRVAKILEFLFALNLLMPAILLLVSSPNSRNLSYFQGIYQPILCCNYTPHSLEQTCTQFSPNSRLEQSFSQWLIHIRNDLIKAENVSANCIVRLGQVRLGQTACRPTGPLTARSQVNGKVLFVRTIIQHTPVNENAKNLIALWFKKCIEL